MTKQALRTALAGALAVVLGMPLAAHHSVSAEYDTTRPITFTGKVIKVEWMNPHIYTNVEAKDETGKAVIFRIEGGAPNSLYRQGWRPDSLKAGDSVTVSGWRSKNPASTNVGLATIRNADGRVIFITPGQNATYEAAQ
jgi:DNA/RNA endonuclease YhcR with UshA esterase domain